MSSPLPKRIARISSGRSYTEAINVLYKCNVFDFKDLRTMIFLPTTILPRRMDSIRSIRLVVIEPEDQIYCSNFYAQWEEACKIISEMSGLQEFVLDLEFVLRLGVEAQVSSGFEIEEKMILEPLMAIKQARNFVVNVSRPMTSVLDPEAPFTLNHLDPVTLKLVPYNKTSSRCSL